MNIKSASDLLGISADTIRYYERGWTCATYYSYLDWDS